MNEAISKRRALHIAALVSLFCAQIAAFSSLPACANKEKLAEFLTESGKKRMEEDDLDGAKNNFSMAIMLAPDYAPAYFWRGEAEQKQDNFPAAAGDFHTAANLYKNPDDKARAYFREAWSERMQGHFKNALQAAESAIKASPKCAECYYWRGRIRADIGDYDAAISDFNQCLNIKSEFTDAFIERGIAYLKSGQYRNAIADIEKYQQSLPKEKIPNQDVLILLGYAYWGINDIGDAEKFFKEAQQKFPDASEPWVGLGSVKLSAGDLKGARDSFDQAVWKENPAPDAYLGRCVVEYLQVDFSTAYDDCVRAKIEYDVYPPAECAMLFTWMTQLRMGQAKWAASAVADFIEASNPIEWRRPVLKYAAGQLGQKEMFAEINKIKTGGTSRLCGAYFFAAQNTAQATRSQFLKEATRVCAPYSLERLAAQYELNMTVKH